MNNDMTTWTHYLPGTNDNATCGTTPAVRAMNGHQVTVFSGDVNCTACLAEIKRMADLGFVPRR